MNQHFLIITLITLVSSPAFAADSFRWSPGIFLNSTPATITKFLGPPSTVMVEHTFAEFVKDKDSGCVNLKVYGFSWSVGTGGDLVLTGPLGLASSAEIWFENDKSYLVQWKYEGNQREAAMEKWITSKEIPIIVGKDNIGTFRPDKDTSAIVKCYSGGDSKSCKGTITAEYMLN